MVQKSAAVTYFRRERNGATVCLSLSVYVCVYVCVPEYVCVSCQDDDAAAAVSLQFTSLHG